MYTNERQAKEYANRIYVCLLKSITFSIMMEKVEDLQDLCRVCLTNQGSFISLFVHVLYEDEHTFNLWEVYEHCTNLEVSEEDELPKTVCEGCLTEFVNVYRFITKCKLSFVHLESLLGSTKNLLISNESFTDDKMDEIHMKIEEPIKNESTFEMFCHVDGSEVKLETSNDSNYKIVKDNNVSKVDCENLEDSIKTESNESQLEQTDDAEDSQVSNLSKSGQFECAVCYKSCKSQSRLTEHVRSHTKEKPYKCTECDAAFSLVSNLIRHTRLHTGEHKYICEICNKGFAQYSTLTHHLSLHTGKEPYVCRCGKSFHSDTICTYALRGYRKRELNRTNSETKDMCKECGTIYTEACHVQNHTAYESEDKRRFLCSICGKAYVSKAGLEHHNLAHTGERPFKCHFCQKSFKNRNALQVHTLTHTGERPNICSVCGKCFVQSAHLTSHQLLHSGVKAHACTFCSKAFSLKGNLTQHLRIHNNETPYQCSVCFKKFRVSNNLKKHTRLHDFNKIEVHK